MEGFAARYITDRRFRSGMFEGLRATDRNEFCLHLCIGSVYIHVMEKQGIKVHEHTKSPGYMLFYCPSCKHAHGVTTQGDKNKEPVWGFNGDLRKPTFTPSVKVTWTESKGPKCCHFFVREGRIEYCGDCTHEFNGKVVDMEDYYAKYGENYAD